jgi:hypothetical protein
MKRSAMMDDRAIYSIDRRERIDRAEVVKVAVGLAIVFALSTMVVIAILS